MGSNHHSPSLVRLDVLPLNYPENFKLVIVLVLGGGHSAKAMHNIRACSLPHYSLKTSKDFLPKTSSLNV